METLTEYGLGNIVVPFKDRSIDLDREVEVYRCLNRKGRIYSIRQGGVVIGHTKCLTMSDVQMVVNSSGYKRFKKRGVRNVHAFLRGKVANRGVMGTTAERSEERLEAEQLPSRINYHPFKYDYFYCDNIIIKDWKVSRAKGLIINKYGVFASYIN